MLNHLVIEGVICKAPRRNTSPAGIPHCQFVLEHYSQQIEAELNRRAYARIQVVASGDVLNQDTQDLCQGCMVRVTGFLNRHESNNGQAMLVLHARRIEKFNQENSNGSLLPTS